VHLKTVRTNMHTMDGITYFARVRQVTPKMFMKLTTSVNFINILHMLITVSAE
jgi:hypothetical protein